jgi:hypothetical protein
MMTLYKFAALPLALTLAAGGALATQGAPAKPAGETKKVTATSERATPPATRNWAKADQNGDHYISPEEMQKYLEDNPGPLRAPSAKS